MKDRNFDETQIVSVKNCKGPLESAYAVEIGIYLRENPKNTIHSFWESKLGRRVRAPIISDLRGCEDNNYIMGW